MRVRASNGTISNEHIQKSILFRPKSLELCGGISIGMFVALLLNPWDRALYCSVTNVRPFIDWRNFSRPFEGVGQSLFQRSISHGLYFPLEKWCMQTANHVTGEVQYKIYL